ncbi:hypothetical protein BDF20DRAFT_987710 [Mycotypha africana]|uniref:uncharacterized protein n=1 Tax=Mycotypha africana TaxID=64632 RepID=UPI00230146BB|nr:uncharacterized protein BDF20DRAFT_987710 [Mycotypha africana]KAI8979449.1 hypothetical protein BDF20DRAFT_987710 [Mycotypha africana]
MSSFIHNDGYGNMTNENGDEVVVYQMKGCSLSRKIYYQDNDYLVIYLVVYLVPEQAICILFCEEYNEDNVKKLTKKVDDFANGEICYIKDPTNPIICSLKTLKANSKYHQYPTTLTKKSWTKSSTQSS